MIIPSIIAKTQKEFETRLNAVSFLDCVHIDVMDGNFVKQTSFMFDVDFSVLHEFAYVEVHLMVENPLLYLEEHRDLFLKATNIIVHCECDIEDVIAVAREYGKLVTLAINPGTTYQKAIDIARLYAITQVLVMTVHPGAYGSAFLPQMIARVSRIAKQYSVICDGAMNERTILKVARSGAKHFVLGSVLQNAADPQALAKALLAQSMLNEPSKHIAKATI